MLFGLGSSAYVLSLSQVENLIGGMRGLKALLWEGSVLDPSEVSPRPTSFPVRYSTQISRVSASMVCPYRIAKSNSLPLQMGKRFFLRACSGSCSLGRFRPRNKFALSLTNLRIVENFLSLLRNSLTRASLPKPVHFQI